MLDKKQANPKYEGGFLPFISMAPNFTASYKL